MAAIEVTDQDFQSRVVDASRTTPVVVDFWAAWCRPCLVLGPMLERLAQEYEGRFVLAKLDVDANPGLAARFAIQGIPAVKAFRDGRVVSEFVGLQPEAVLRRFLDQVLPSEADDLVARARADEASGALGPAEAAYRQALEARPDHEGAAAGLARVLAGTGRLEEARALVERLPHHAEARAVAASLDLMEMAARPGPLGEVARAGAAGEHRMALDRALELIAEGDQRDEARRLMLRVFQLLGDEDPLTREYRPRLAGALF